MTAAGKWVVPLAPRPDLLARFGRRWVVTLRGTEVHARRRFSRFWSKAEADAEAAILNAVRVHFGQDAEWAVADLRSAASRLSPSSRITPSLAWHFSPQRRAGFKPRQFPRRRAASQVRHHQQGHRRSPS